MRVNIRKNMKKEEAVVGISKCMEMLVLSDGEREEFEAEHKDEW